MFECKVLANSLTARSLKTDTVLMWKVRQVHGMSDRYNGMSDRHTTFSCGMSDMCKYSHVECLTGTVECQTRATLSHVKCQTCVKL